MLAMIIHALGTALGAALDAVLGVARRLRQFKITTNGLVAVLLFCASVAWVSVAAHHARVAERETIAAAEAALVGKTNADVAAVIAYRNGQITRAALDLRQIDAELAALLDKLPAAKLRDTAIDAAVTKTDTVTILQPVPVSLPPDAPPEVKPRVVVKRVREVVAGPCDLPTAITATLNQINVGGGQ